MCPTSIASSACRTPRTGSITTSPSASASCSPTFSPPPCPPGTDEDAGGRPGRPPAGTATRKCSRCRASSSVLTPTSYPETANPCGLPGICGTRPAAAPAIGPPPMREEDSASTGWGASRQSLGALGTGGGGGRWKGVPCGDKDARDRCLLANAEVAMLGLVRHESGLGRPGRHGLSDGQPARGGKV